MAEETVISINPASPKPVLRKPGEAPAKPDLRLDSVAPAAPVPEAPPACETLADERRPESLDRLKGMTQRLKAVTQEIPAQAILHRTGIIANQAAASESQTQAAKSKTMRISLSEALGAAPTNEDASDAPMKTIRVKRPVALPRPVEAVATGTAEAAAPSVTQRRTLRIARPGGTHPRASARLARPAMARPQSDAENPGVNDIAAVGDIPEIADLPETPVQAGAAASKAVADVPGAVTVLSLVVQIAACAAMGFVAWMLFQNCTLIAQ